MLMNIVVSERQCVKMMPKVSIPRKIYDVLLGASLQIRKIANLQIQRDMCTLRMSDDYDLTGLFVDSVLIKVQYCV